MKTTCGVYKITSPSNKIYIGSSVNIERRILCYKYLQCKQQPKIYNSLKKYGYQNHIIEIIEECDVSNLIERENYWVTKYNSIHEGLNLQTPGENQIHIERTISFNRNWCSKISKSKKGKSVFNTKKPILQYDLKGNFIKEYESAKEAQRQTGISNSAINNNLKNISKQSGGYVWKYKK
jgi:hypothetical protein